MHGGVAKTLPMTFSNGDCLYTPSKWRNGRNDITVINVCRNIDMS